MTLMARSYDTGPIEWQHAHHTTLQSRLRRCAVGVMIGLLVVTPAAGALAQELEVADPIAAAAQEASGWPDFDPSDMSQEVAETEARQAVAGWPDFDPSDMSQEVAATEAQQEAAAWPDFDPSDMSQEVAITKAQQEAATWPNYDSTALADPANQIVVASGSPRMTQIAASQAQADGDDAAVARGRSYPTAF